ncbi:MAG: hypothetical protein ACON4C_10755 [Henriciella sp.]
MILWVKRALWALCLVALPAEAQSPEDRGRATYFGDRGSALDDATAQIASTTASLPANVFPCSNCHGEFGTGKPERGILPPNLSRTALTRPYDVIGQRGRRRGPYTLESFGRVLREGIDPSGNSLDVAMPRFSLSDQAIEELWAFLDTVHQSQDPGISDESLRLVFLYGGAVAQDPRLTRQLAQVVNGMMEDINLRGGIHGRQLAVDYVSEPNATAIDEAFLVLSLGAPEVAPGQDVLLIQTQGPTGLGRRAYSLYSGAEEQAAALRAFAVQELGLVRVTDWACVDEAAARAYLITAPDCLPGLPETKPVLLTQFAFEALTADQRRGLPEQVFVALPSGADQIPQASQYAFVRFMRSKQISPSEAVLLQAQAYSLVSVALEGLMQSGRTLSRSVFTEQLETLDQYLGAVGPPLSFGRNRRVGNGGARIAQFDPRTQTFRPDATWIDVADIGRP